MPKPIQTVFPTQKHLKGLNKLLKFFKTQTAIAESLGISRQTVNDWYCGRKVITEQYAYRLERMLQDRITIFELRPDLSKKDLRMPKF